jgi:bisphosphoglycerate-dependent phosphoglycerate mutase
MNYFQSLIEKSNQFTEIANDYLSKLPELDNDEIAERIWQWAIQNENNELAEEIINDGIPYYFIPRNGSLKFALGYSIAAHEANLRSLLEFVENRQNCWIKFQCI